MKWMRKKMSNAKIDIMNLQLEKVNAWKTENRVQWFQIKYFLTCHNLSFIMHISFLL